MSLCRATVILLLILCLQACGSTVRGPAEVRDPVPVFLLDHGIHSSVVFPRESGDAVAYCFSSFDYAAAGNDGALNGPVVLLGSSGGTLGRRQFHPGAPRADAVCDAFMQGETYYHIDACFPIVVERSARERVFADLERRWEAAAATRIDSAKRRFSFVRVPTRYGLFHTCNNESLDWLKDMGCRVSGIGLAADFQVEPADPRALARATEEPPTQVADRTGDGSGVGGTASAADPAPGTSRVGAVSNGHVGQ